MPVNTSSVFDSLKQLPPIKPYEARLNFQNVQSPALSSGGNSGVGCYDRVFVHNADGAAGIALSKAYNSFVSKAGQYFSRCDVRIAQQMLADNAGIKRTILRVSTSLLGICCAYFASRSLEAVCKIAPSQIRRNEHLVSAAVENGQIGMA